MLAMTKTLMIFGLVVMVANAKEHTDLARLRELLQRHHNHASRPGATGKATSAVELEKVVERAMAKAADKVTPGLKALVDKIAAMIPPMKDDINKIHASDQTSMDEHAASVEKCNSELATEQGKLKTKHETAVANFDKHKSCRTGDEATAAKLNADCPPQIPPLQEEATEECEARDKAQVIGGEFSACKASCDYHTQSPESCWNTAKAAVKDFEDLFIEGETACNVACKKCAEAKKALADKKLECTKKETAHLEAKNKCDLLQLDAELGDCGVTDFSEAMCTAHAGCRSDSEGAFKQAKTAALEQEEDRKKEWTATHKIECLTKAWTAEGTVNIDQVTKCEQEPVDTAHLVLNIKEPVADPGCTTIPLPNYANEYSTFPKECPAAEVTQCEGAAEPTQAPAGGCCKAQKAECLACAVGMTQDDYCINHPNTPGCWE